MRRCHFFIISLFLAVAIFLFTEPQAVFAQQNQCYSDTNCIFTFEAVSSNGYSTGMYIPNFTTLGWEQFTQEPFYTEDSTIIIYGRGSYAPTYNRASDGSSMGTAGGYHFADLRVCPPSVTHPTIIDYVSGSGTYDLNPNTGFGSCEHRRIRLLPIGGAPGQVSFDYQKNDYTTTYAITSGLNEFSWSTYLLTFSQDPCAPTRAPRIYFVQWNATSPTRTMELGKNGGLCGSIELPSSTSVYEKPPLFPGAPIEDFEDVDEWIETNLGVTKPELPTITIIPEITVCSNLGFFEDLCDFLNSLGDALNRIVSLVVGMVDITRAQNLINYARAQYALMEQIISPVTQLYESTVTQLEDPTAYTGITLNMGTWYGTVTFFDADAIEPIVTPARPFVSAMIIILSVLLPVREIYYNVLKFGSWGGTEA